ncbi:3-oxoacyl-[acyl-carrier-protein] reductase FabG [Diplonema papillatum]|nr:3-oxoacyl-[acyl-carrier-protein] reductase FabG [Diplonema papillatum]
MREMTKETADEVVRAVVKETGKKLHYVAHVAGIAPSSLLMRTHPDEIDELLRINVTGPLMLTRSALQYGGLLSQSSGSAVCFVGSVVGERGNKGQVAYAASKAALSGAAKSLAKEYGGKGLRVNVVAPGFISTDLTADIPERARAAIAEATALGRFGTAEEVADAVHFALTATFLTGQTILLDGGLTI